MSDFETYNEVTVQFARMQKNHINFCVYGDTIALTGLAGQHDKNRYVFETVAALTYFLDGYLIGLNYQGN